MICPYFFSQLSLWKKFLIVLAASGTNLTRNFVHYSFIIFYFCFTLHWGIALKISVFNRLNKTKTYMTNWKIWMQLSNWLRLIVLLVRHLINIVFNISWDFIIYRQSKFSKSISKVVFHVHIYLYFIFFFNSYCNWCIEIILAYLRSNRGTLFLMNNG